MQIVLAGQTPPPPPPPPPPPGPELSPPHAAVSPNIEAPSKREILTILPPRDHTGFSHLERGHTRAAASPCVSMAQPSKDRGEERLTQRLIGRTTVTTRQSDTNSGGTYRSQRFSSSSRCTDASLAPRLPRRRCSPAAARRAGA